MSTIYRRNQTLAQAAAWLGCSDEHLRRAIRAGAPHERLGAGKRAPIRVDPDELREWLRDQREAARAGSAGAR